VIALGLALLAAVLIWPVPTLLARSGAALRHPVAALLLWQGIGLGTGFAAIGAGLAYGFSHRSALATTAVLAAFVVAVYLLAVAVVVTGRTLAQRRRHRQVLDLVGTPLPALPGGVKGGLLLDSTTAMAYCLPGLRPRMVVTSAALADLTPRAFAAVVVHERAHLSQRHDLVVLPFVAWHAALPSLPGARTARAAVALLVEALADDAARTRVGSQPLGEALRAVALVGGPPGATTAEAPPSVDVRLARLGDRLRTPLRSAVVGQPQQPGTPGHLG
jgi:Zn-dependent protease with chaperone function